MATQYVHRSIIVIDTVHRDQANARAKETDTAGGQSTFTEGLSATGSAPATHYWCNWQMLTSERGQVHARVGGLHATQVRIYNGNVVTPADVLTTLGLKEIL